MAAVEVREQTSASPNGRVQERYAEPRGGRYLKRGGSTSRLGTTTPPNTRTSGHGYEADRTTDPDYGIEGIHPCKFDAAGIELMVDIRTRRIQRAAGDTDFDKLDDHVELEVGVHYMKTNSVVRPVFPDLMVLPRVNMLGMASEPDRALRFHQGNPPPSLVLELLSHGGAQRDLGDRLWLYTDLGVREYLMYDLRGKRRKGSPRELLLYRLEAGAYEQAEPLKKASASGPEVHWRGCVWHKHSHAIRSAGRVQFPAGTAAAGTPLPVVGRGTGPQARPPDRCGRRAGTSGAGDAPPACARTGGNSDGTPADAVARVLAVHQAPHEWYSLLVSDKPDYGSNGGPCWGPHPRRGVPRRNRRRQVKASTKGRVVPRTV